MQRAVVTWPTGEQRIIKNPQINTRQFIAGQGYLTDQAPELVFGLGDATNVQRAVVTWPTGEQHIIKNPQINTRHRIAR